MTDTGTAARYPENTAIGAYAPGRYMCRCLTCGGSFEGDKRAISCRGCALAFASKLSAPVERERVAMVIGSFLIHDDHGGPDDIVLQDVIGGDYEESIRRVYELTDQIIALFALQPLGGGGEGGSSRDIAPGVQRTSLGGGSDQ